ncbi:MAG TPA: hypothetical protein VNX47_15240 [Nevskia sp.]|nr:hypothetical protein [Nevskia sp.]
MNPIHTLRFCIKLGCAAFALLAPDIALVVLPALGLLSRRAPAGTLPA